MFSLNRNKRNTVWFTSMSDNVWQASFEVAGLFLPDQDFQLTPKILVKRSHKREAVLDNVEPVHKVIVSVNESEFKDSKSYDVGKFGTNKFAEESEFGVAEERLKSALSYYTLKTRYPTAILRRDAAWSLTAIGPQGLGEWTQFRGYHLSPEQENQLKNRTIDVINSLPRYDEATRADNRFVKLAVRYCWMAKNIHQEHLEFLNYVIALEVLLKLDEDKSPQVSKRAALLLASDDKEDVYAIEKLKQVYKMRNAIVHEGDDLVQYDLLNFLEDSLQHIVDKMVMLSGRIPTSSDTAKARICKILDEALDNSNRREQIRNLTL